MTKRISETLRDELLAVVELWKKQGGGWPAPVAAIVDFAIRNNLYNAHARMRRQAARDFAEAMRESYFHDGNGRPIRRLHAARFSDTDDDGKKHQQTLWHDIDTADRGFMEVAFQQRRRQIVGDCRQLHNDVRYFNERHPKAAPIQTYFDFRDDVLEADQPRHYRVVEGGQA